MCLLRQRSLVPSPRALASAFIMLSNACFLLGNKLARPNLLLDKAGGLLARAVDVAGRSNHSSDGWSACVIYKQCVEDSFEACAN